MDNFFTFKDRDQHLHEVSCNKAQREVQMCSIRLNVMNNINVENNTIAFF